MNIIKIGFLVLAGLGFGFGVDQITEQEETQIDRQDYNEEGYYGFCHGGMYFFEDIVDAVSEENRVVVQDKIDDLLVEHNITLEELENDYILYHEVMMELMEFLYENDIDFHFTDEDNWHHGMWRSR